MMVAIVVAWWAWVPWMRVTDSTAAAAPPNASAPEPATQLFVCEFAQGPRWQAGKPVREQAGFAEHLAFMKRLNESGALAAAGPYADGLGGGLTLLRAASVDEAARIMDAEPFVRHRVLTLDAVRAWTIGMSTLCGPVAAKRAGGAGAPDASAHPGPLSLAADGRRVLSKEVVVPATLAEVWHCWTTPEGIASFFSSESNVELRVGGPYELYMSATAPDATGKRGSEGCRVLSFVPHEMLSFEWNFSPATPGLRASGAKTFVVLRFEALGSQGVRVRFDQLGWQEGEAWDAGYAYFDKAWDWVLGSLKNRFAPPAEGADGAPGP